MTEEKPRQTRNVANIRLSDADADALREKTGEDKLATAARLAIRKYIKGRRS